MRIVKHWACALRGAKKCISNDFQVTITSKIHEQICEKAQDQRRGKIIDMIRSLRQRRLKARSTPCIRAISPGIGNHDTSRVSQQWRYPVYSRRSWQQQRLPDERKDFSTVWRKAHKKDNYPTLSQSTHVQPVSLQ